jgi:putative transposase
VGATSSAIRSPSARPHTFSHRRLVVLPDHMHWGPRPWGRCRKTMPISGPVASEQGRVREIAAARRAAITGHDPPRRTRHFATAVLEHTIRDDRDFAAHIDHTHFNPVKHGLLAHPADWHSSFRRCVAGGMCPADWRGGSDEPQQTGERQ